MSGTAATLLRSARKAAGLSRRAVAAKAGVPISTISRIEDASSDPTVTMLERVLAAAGCRLVADAVPGDMGPAISRLATAADDSGGRLKIDWTRLRAFADWASEHPERLAASIADPPVRTGTVLDAILAAFAEELASEHGIDRPRWTRTIGALASEWSPPATPRMRAEAAATTPEPFRRRQIVLAKAALIRAA